MRNPLQTTITHAEPAFDSFSAALGRALYAIGWAVEHAGMVAIGRARATLTPEGHEFPLVVVSVVAGGPDLPDPPPEYHDLPDLEADGYSWGPNARDLLYAGLAGAQETPC